MKILLPEKVSFIISQLENAGFEAFAVGGCVRDAVLGRIPSDWDITTSASPQQVKKIFPRTVDTGIEHGTVTVMLGREGFEVTTYRIDGTYTDARHPDGVTFTSSLTEDLRRRDFTVNAMAYSDRCGLVDEFGGLEDLKKHVIRCVGEPRERFGEDALRILRAVRFAAQLDFTIDPPTQEAVRRQCGELKLISAERIRTELEKLLVSDHPQVLKKAWELGVTKVILPEFDAIMAQPQNNAHHVYSAGDHTIIAVQSVRPDRILRFTMLFHDMGKASTAAMDEKEIWHFKNHAAASEKIAVEIMKRLKFDNASLHIIRRLVAVHSLYPEESERGVRMAVQQTGCELFPLFLEVKRADILAQNPKVQEKKIAYLDRISRMYERILERGDCLNLKQLAVNGQDLMEEGVPKGKMVGSILNELLCEVLEEPSRNTREYLLDRVRKMLAALTEDVI